MLPLSKVNGGRVLPLKAGDLSRRIGLQSYLSRFNSDSFESERGLNMSLKVLNKKFLCLLQQLSIDIEQFPDKSFDSLFESKHIEQGYFFEWFVDNISSENALTEAEVDVYNYLLKNNLTVTDGELNFAFTNYTPTYEDLNALNDNYIRNSLVAELNDLNKEYQYLQSIISDLDSKFSPMKTKRNSLKEECNRYKKMQNQLIEELKNLNSSFGIIYKGVSSYNLGEFSQQICIQDLSNALDRGSGLNYDSAIQNLIQNKVNSLSNSDRAEIHKIKTELETSNYLYVFSKSISEEIKYKTLKAEEFLKKLKDEGNSHYTFEELFNVWCNATELKTYDSLNEKIKLFQCHELYRELQKDCELTWNCFLSKSYSLDSSEIKMKLSKYLEYLDIVKYDVACNILLLQVLSQTAHNEKKCAKSLDWLYYVLNKNWNKEKAVVDTLNWENKRYQENLSHINEKHALFLSCKKINAGESPSKKMYLKRAYDDVKLLVNDPYFCSTELFGKIQQRVTSCISHIVSGPTNQIQMAPIQLQLDFNKCRKLLAELSHSVQRLLTEYVSIKESLSSNERRQMLLWIDFLMNPKLLTECLQELQSRSVKCLSNSTAMKV